jgi:preprotein translocase SecE subunit
MAKMNLVSKLKKIAATPFIAIGRFLKNITYPIRANKSFRRARRTFLKSPFKGYFKDSYNELKMVTWPDRATALKLTGTVIVFSLTFAVFTTLLDIGFEKIAKKIFLN